MKQFIVAVDFSKSSIHALEYAISLARHSNAGITMIWVDKPESDDSVFQEPRDGQHRKDIKSRFEQLISNYSGAYPELELNYKQRCGKIYFEIGNIARQLNADLIIAGAHGVSGFEEYWIGSNSYRIVSSAPCPVITIRSDFSFNQKIERILMPFDHTSETLLKVEYTLSFAEAFNSDIHIVGVYGTNLATMNRKIDENLDKVRKIVEQHGFKPLIEKVRSSNVTNAIISYAEEKKVDLISIMTEQHKSGSVLNLGPYANQIVNHSPIPILSIQNH